MYVQKSVKKRAPWLPDGYSQIFSSYVIASPRPPPWRNPRKGRDQILPSGTGNHARRGQPSIFIPVDVGKDVGEDLEDDELEVLRDFGGVDADGLEDEHEVDRRPADREHDDHHEHEFRHSPFVPANKTERDRFAVDWPCGD